MKNNVLRKTVLALWVVCSACLIAAPTPDPLTWSVSPTAVGVATIYMKATAATDVAGVEYFFDCLGDDTFDSGWQGSDVYYRGGYASGMLYQFRVKARDKSASPSETQWSQMVSTTTASETDTLPPVLNPSQWEKVPHRLSSTTIQMEALASYDEYGSPVQYFFECVSTTDSRYAANPGALSSGWSASPLYRRSGLLTASPGNVYKYRVRVRDAVGNLTDWSSQASVFLAPPPVVREVPFPYLTIQSAIDAANNGDTVIVHPGTYGNNPFEEDIDFKKKAITVRSENPEDPAIVAATIIDPLTNGTGGSDRAFIFKSGEEPSSVLEGFTIQNARSWYPNSGLAQATDAFGGAIACLNGSSPTIRRCIIKNCVADGSGDDGDPGVPNTDPNLAVPGEDGGDANPAGGGGIYCDSGSSPLIEYCTITGCSVIANGGRGGDGQDPFDPNNPPAGSVGGNGGNADANTLGGGIYCASGSAAVISNCILSNNTVNQGLGGSGGAGEIPGEDGISSGVAFGGGVCHGIGNTVSISVTDISSNLSDNWGGGLWCAASCKATLKDSQFDDNTAKKDCGGGLGFDAGSSVTLMKCLISGNKTNSDFSRGGGLWFNWGGTLTLDNTEVTGNRASSTEAAGGGIFAGNMAHPLATTVILQNNSMVSDNISQFGGGLCIEETNLTVDKSVINGNSAFYGGGIFAADSKVSIADSSFSLNMVESADVGNPYCSGASLYSLNSILGVTGTQFMSNTATGFGGAVLVTGPAPDYSPQFFTGCTFEGNISGLGGGALAVTVGGEVDVADSNFVDNTVLDKTYGAGGGILCYDAFVNIINTNLYDNAAALGPQIAIGDPYELFQSYDPTSVVLVDYSYVQGGQSSIFVGKGGWTYLGYGDYNKIENPQTTRDLYVSIKDGSGTVTWLGKTSWPKGAVVQLQATPSKASDSVQWNGTDDDTLLTTTNTVTMTSRKEVEVRFYTPTMYDVFGDFTDLHYAIHAAQDGDIIILHPGIYDPVQASAAIIDKNIIIQSYNPDDPNVVANTVIIGSDWVPGGMSETSGLAEPTPGGYFRFEGTDRTAVLNGITIQDAHWRGKDGLPGKTEYNTKEDGMNGVGVSGGAISFIDNASATIKNCRFVNCSATGGNGGNGTNLGDGGWGGCGRGGAISIGSGNPRFINCQFIGNYARGGGGGDAGDGDIMGRGGSWEDPLAPWSGWDFGPYRYYWKYSGFGGAVYCDTGSKPEFTNCLFRDNTVYGGHTGEGDGPGGFPFGYYKIDRYGGAVYGAKGSTITFKDCVFENNTADTVGPEKNYKDDSKTTTQEDPYYAYGGAIAFEDDVVVTIADCNFAGGLADHGGGVYAEYGTLNIADSNFAENVSTFGGALYYVKSKATLERSVFNENDANQPESQGGGVFAFDSNSVLTDTVFTDNRSDLSGGALFLAGGETIMKNALIVRNKAVRDGAGISADWYAEVDVQSATLANNEVLGTSGGVSKGGGIYAGYQTYMDVVNSILWGNSASEGQQIAIGTGFEYDPVPSIVDIKYSDVQGGRGFTAISVEKGCTLKWTDADMLQADPLFVGPAESKYYLSQPNAKEPNAPTSPCIDKGNASASSVGLDKYTTTYPIPRFDFGIVDMGYHYPFEQKANYCAYADFAYKALGYQLDGLVGLNDLIILASFWLNDNCNQSNRWCQGADLNLYSGVDFDDFAFLSSCWGTVDIESPKPNPAQWQTAPAPVDNTTDSITMEAVQATDNWIGGVEYNFENLTNPAHSSGWRQSFDTERPGYVADAWKYKDTGLIRDKAYTYVVKVRDMAGNETAASQAASAIPGIDVFPPTPNPSQWAVEPYQLSQNSIRMQAVQATDAEGFGVEYLFVCVENNAFSSGWRQNVSVSSPGYVANPWLYEATGLTLGQTYTFYIKTRDRSLSQNETAPSPSVSVTIVEIDSTPPTPNPAVIVTVTLSNYPAGSIDWYHIVTAQAAQDDSGVEYQFTSTNGAPIEGNNAKWRYDEIDDNAAIPRPSDTVNCSTLTYPNGAVQTARTIWVKVNRAFRYTYRVQYRDQSPASNKGTISAPVQSPVP